MARTVVVVGASVGGVRTAQALRSEGFEGRVVLVGEESRIPYDKPPLSKQFLAGTWDEARLELLSAEAASEVDIELRLGVAAECADIAGKQLILADGERMPYDVLVVATGAAARPSPWTPDSGVHVLRTLDDGAALHAELAAGAPVVVVGGGFIGAEVAATARSLGCEVTVVDPLRVPMGRVLGQDMGAHFVDLHHRHGVQTRFGTGVAGVEGRAGELRVALTDGEVLRAATVVVGIGAAPNDGWLRGSGLLLDDGVVCDEYCRAVDAPTVFAVGDVARWYHPGHRQHVRVEHWTNAVDQAACVAYNVTHPDDLRGYRPVEYVWSDQYDWRVQILGRPALTSEHHLIGNLSAAQPRAAALYTDGTQLRAAMTINWPRGLGECRRLIAAHVGFDQAVGRLHELAAVPPRLAVGRTA